MNADKMIVRRFFLFLIIIMIISAFPFADVESVRAADKEATIESETDLTAEPGSEITVPLKIADNPGIAGMGLVLSYDENVLTPVSVETTDLTSQGTCDDSIETSVDNTFKIIWASSDNVTEDGAVFNVKFKVSDYADGNISVRLSYIQKDTFDEELGYVVLNCSDININVKRKDSAVTTLRSIQNQTVEAGNSITVPIVLDNADKLDSLSFDLLYDKNEFTDVISTEDELGKSTVSTIEGGLHFHVSEIDTTAQTGTIVNITFATKANRTGFYVFSIESGNAATENFRVKVTENESSENAVIYCEREASDSPDNIALAIKIKKNKGIAGFRFTLNYDSTKLSPVSATKDEALRGSFGNTIGKEDTSFDVVWFNADNYYDDSVLFRVVFQKQENAYGPTTIGLDYSQPDTCDEHSKDVVLTMENYELQLGNKPVSIKDAKITGVKSVKYRKKMSSYVKSLEDKYVVTLNGKELVKGVDYKVTSKFLNVGRGKVVFTGLNDYTDSIEKTVWVKPAGASLKKPKKLRKAIKVIWKRQSLKMSKSRIAGYQIRYSTSKKMKKAKKVKVKGYRKTSKTIKKLKARKKYYIQIRTYKKASGKTLYSSWSKKKAIKTK